MNSSITVYGKTFVRSALAYKSLVKPGMAPGIGLTSPSQCGNLMVRKAALSVSSMIDEDVRAVLGISDVADYGSCFCRSLLLCASLRSCGFGEDEVYVVVGCHRGESFLEATHASVLVTTDEVSCIANPSSVATENQVRYGDDKVRSFFQHTTIACLFNDVVGWFCVEV